MAQGAALQCSQPGVIPLSYPGAPSALLMLNEQQFYLFGQIQTCQIGGQSNSDTYPYYGECSLHRP